MKYKKALWVYLLVSAIAGFTNAWIHNLPGTIFCCTVMIILSQEVRDHE